MPLLLAALLAALILDDTPAKPPADASPKAATAADPALAERYKQMIREFEVERVKAVEAARKEPTRDEALLGVACDEKAAALRAIETERMDWPHWTGDGISGRYDVYSFPTVVVLDARGVIRSMNARGADLDKLIDDLLKEMESKDGPKSPAANPH